ncbi:putative g-protein coupled receptor [Erysiphe neolycopersici]|uniref:Putative g-protein coupled receptor n=1 Tax=Erysiphe neolycopersici TaxID=212602 RepID=A0A420I061_9PEZI|nr:putative g-protein coupled receptor [Erysiphe neolycopersici]
MSSNFTRVGPDGCPSPFLEAGLFTEKGGFLEGRFCSNLSGTNCCLPCPHAQWLYPNNFEKVIERASWINFPGLLCSIFLIASFITLPAKQSRRHYLSVCLVTSVAVMNIAFLIPLGAKPAQCHDTITPNDMKSSTICAISGALVIAGGWFGVIWVSLITLYLHLQICWQLEVGEIFMSSAITAGCTIPMLGVAVALGLSGVSFRIGSTCHVNAERSLISLWIPLLLIASLTLFMQLATFTYCLRVYLASLGDYLTMSPSSAGKSQDMKRNVLSPKKAYQRVHAVIQLQWRSILVVLVIVADVIFFAVVFVSLNQVESSLANGSERFTPWLNCLIETGGDTEKCFIDTNTPRVSEGTVVSVLVLLSLNGFWCLILLGRFSMLTGWRDLISGKSKTELEFVSADARSYKNPTDYEMLANMSDHGKPPELLKAPSRAILYDSCEQQNLSYPAYLWNSSLVKLDDHQSHQRKYLV